MNIDDIRENIKKYFRGEGNQEGHTLVDRWYHYFDDESDQLTDYSEEEKKELRNHLIDDINKSINDSSNKGRWVDRYNNQRNNSISRLTKFAAGFIIILLASLPILYYQGFFVNSDDTYRLVSNPAGQSSKITLADGSTVWLSASSTLKYPQKFNGNTRHVILKGEAFFDVMENPGKPFIVDSGDLQTKVLGTSFNIRGFEEEKNIQVTVATGRVAVEVHNDKKDQVKNAVGSFSVLTPNQQLTFNKETNRGRNKTVPAAQYTSWKEGRLIFDNQTFEEIARRLERWYGVKIHFAETSLKQIRFKITFENNSLEHALKMLQVIENFEFKMEGNHVWVK